MRSCAPLLLLSLAVVLAACTGAELNLPTGPDVVPSARAVALLADSLATATTPASRQARVVRALQRAGVTPLADMGRRDSENPRFVVDGPVTAGFIPGRHPLARTDLVVVSTDIDGPYAVPLLEATRVLVERSQWVTAPERTVLVAFRETGGSIEPVLRAGVWPRTQVREVMVVGTGGRGPNDIPGSMLLPGDADAVGVAGDLVDAITRMARRPPPVIAPADTTATP